MPLVLKEESKVFGTTFLWRMDEDISFFASAIEISQDQRELIQTWVVSRQKEWLASRYLIDHYLKHPAQLVKNDQFGKPYIKNSVAEISISHSGNYVAVLHHPHIDVGIDIQTFSDKIARIAHKFCSENDHQLFDQSNSEDEAHHYVWTAKEAAFKTYAKKELDFRKHIILSNLKSTGYKQTLTAQVNKNENIEDYIISLRKIGRLYIAQSFSSNAIE